TGSANCTGSGAPTTPDLPSRVADRLRKTFPGHLRWRILLRIRRFLRPTFRRPLLLRLPAIFHLLKTVFCLRLPGGAPLRRVAPPCQAPSQNVRKSVAAPQTARPPTLSARV